VSFTSRKRALELSRVVWPFGKVGVQLRRLGVAALFHSLSVPSGISPGVDIAVTKVCRTSWEAHVGSQAAAGDVTLTGRVVVVSARGPPSSGWAENRSSSASKPLSTRCVRSAPASLVDYGMVPMPSRLFVPVAWRTEARRETDAPRRPVDVPIAHVPAESAALVRVVVSLPVSSPGTTTGFGTGPARLLSSSKLLASGTDWS
jgi:hypothetical protein